MEISGKLCRLNWWIKRVKNGTLKVIGETCCPISSLHYSALKMRYGKLIRNLYFAIWSLPEQDIRLEVDKSGLVASSLCWNRISIIWAVTHRFWKALPCMIQFPTAPLRVWSRRGSCRAVTNFKRIPILKNAKKNRLLKNTNTPKFYRIPTNFFIIPSKNTGRKFDSFEGAAIIFLFTHGGRKDCTTVAQFLSYFEPCGACYNHFY